MNVIVFDSGDEPFFEWMELHPSGYVLNTERRQNSKLCFLHRSKCSHLTGLVSGQGPNGYTMKDYIKVCSEQYDSLLMWTIKNRPRSNGFSDFCKDCFTDEVEREKLTLDIATLIAVDISSPPRRVVEKTSRIVRDTALSQRAKLLNDHCCQICGESVLLFDGKRYIEAHHIIPLGKPHNGLDEIGNIICVCPNHHVQLDFGAIYLESESLRFASGHPINPKSIEYHNKKIYKGAE